MNDTETDRRIDAIDRLLLRAIKDRDIATEERDNALDSLRLCREELRLARIAIGRARELLLDSAKPFDEACLILAQTGGQP